MTLRWVLGKCGRQWSRHRQWHCSLRGWWRLLGCCLCCFSLFTLTLSTLPMFHWPYITFLQPSSMYLSFPVCPTSMHLFDDEGGMEGGERVHSFSSLLSRYDAQREKRLFISSHSSHSVNWPSIKVANHKIHCVSYISSLVLCLTSLSAGVEHSQGVSFMQWIFGGYKCAQHFPLLSSSLLSWMMSN